MKKIIALALAMMFVFVLAVPAFADETFSTSGAPIGADNLPDFDTVQDGESLVTYTMKGSYVVSIPANIPFTEDVPGANNVKVESLMLGYNQTLTVGAKYDGVLDLMIAGESKSQLEYELKNNGSSVAAGDTYVVVATVSQGANGFIDVTGGAKLAANLKAGEKAQYAGNYTDTVTFEIKVNDPA